MTFYVLDTETTGLGSDAEIVEIAIISHMGEIVLNQLVRPSAPVSDDVVRIHGITNEMLADAPTFDAIYEQVLSIVQNNVIYIYNHDYDSRLLNQSAAIYQLSPIYSFAQQIMWTKSRCIMKQYAEFWGEWSDYRNSYAWQKLSVACSHQAIKIDNAHRALGDCRMTLALMNKLGWPKHEQ